MDDLAEFLGKKTKGKSFNDEIKKVLDDAVEYIKRNKDSFKKIRNEINKSNISTYKNIYGSFVKKGNIKFQNSFKREVKKIKPQKIANENKKQWTNDHKIKKISEPINLYLKRRLTLEINKRTGKLAEELFVKLNGGGKNIITKNGRIREKSIKSKLSNRFVDNIKDNTIKEVKSGYIENNSKNWLQIRKDFDIVANRIEGVKKAEWHFLEGIDEQLLERAYKLAHDNKLLNSIEFIFY